ncbi:MAG: MBL fold metallo-hydrolase [Hellea sp.]|nr:MBL fold metallo-hydrolase [Hellea sp.]
MRRFASLLLALGGAVPALAHEPAEARYIANEAVMVTHGETKIMFDPFFTSGFGTYMEVPTEAMEKILANAEPYDGVDAIFVSHVHGDHFDGPKIFDYMQKNREVEIFLPEQGARYLRDLAADDDQALARLFPFELIEDGPTLSLDKGNIFIDAVRIPHSGWPRKDRKDINNIVFRVTLHDEVTVAHMGDADINMDHYAPYAEHWQTRTIDMGFPPYWIYLYPGGSKILETMNVKDSVGVHVPIEVPNDLKRSGADFLSVSGETRAISHSVNSKAESGCAPVTFDGADFTVCEFSAADDIRLFWGEGEVPFEHFEALNIHLEGQGEELVFAMNAGMYHPDRTPVGLYFADGEQKQNLMVKASSGNFGLLPNGVFHGGFGHFGVSETSLFALKNTAHEFATQSGPMLVIDGKLHPRFRQSSDSVRRRNGVGVKGEQIFFAISEEPVNFHHFARLFKDELETPNALYLDGGVSRLYDADSGRHDRGIRMGPIVGVVR